MTECIHGLEIPLCDICYPKAAPERPRVSRPAAAHTPRAGSATTTRTSVKAGEHRAYHVTHIRNLAGIVSRGALGVDASPAVDVSSELTRELRMSAAVPPSEASVAEHVPFYLAPDAQLWDDLRAGAHDETRWSDAARKTTPHDFVFLVTTLAQLGPDVVIADGDAAATYTRFASGDGIQRMIERLHGDEASRRNGEALVPGTVPLSAIQLIGVANDPVRDAVRELVGGLAPTPKVAVYPPWFQLS